MVVLMEYFLYLNFKKTTTNAVQTIIFWYIISILFSIY